MTDKQFNIIGHDNEDIVRCYMFPFSPGYPDEPMPFNVYDVQMDIVDLKTRQRVLRLTTNEGDGLIQVLDEIYGKAQLTIPRGAIPYVAGQRLVFDMLSKRKSDGRLSWVLAGTVEIKQGLTAGL